MALVGADGLQPHAGAEGLVVELAGVEQAGAGVDPVVHPMGGGDAVTASNEVTVYAEAGRSEHYQTAKFSASLVVHLDAGDTPGEAVRQFGAYLHRHCDAMAVAKVEEMVAEAAERERARRRIPAVVPAVADDPFADDAPPLSTFAGLEHPQETAAAKHRTGTPVQGGLRGAPTSECGCGDPCCWGCGAVAWPQPQPQRRRAVAA